MRSLAPFLLASGLVLLGSHLASAADGGLDAGSSDAATATDAASADASDLDADAAATDDASSDASLDAPKDGPTDTPPSDDSGPVTFRPDTGTPADDAGTDPGGSGGCSCRVAGSSASHDGGGSSGNSGGLWVAGLGLALAVSRIRRTRRHSR